MLNILTREYWSKALSNSGTSPQPPQEGDTQSPPQAGEAAQQQGVVQASFEGRSGYSYVNSFSVSYNGEKNLGEAGPIIDYHLDYAGLSMRSWDLYLTSEVAQTVLGKYATWVVGTGLKLQANPQKLVLGSEGIALDDEAVEEFNRLIEARYSVYANCEMADIKDEKSLNELAHAAYISAIVGGDCLIVQRVVNGVVKTQLVDGAHVQTPLGGNIRTGLDGFINQDTGNRIIHGVEIDNWGKHVAYHVRTELLKWERIEARSTKTGHRMAWLMYGLEYRLDEVRGMPLVVAVIETAKKMDRYKEATLGTAEELAKLVYAVEHELQASGENPMMQQLAKAMNPNGGVTPTDVNGTQLANNVQATTNKSTFNLPPGASLKPVKGADGTVQFKDFYLTNFDIFCACVTIPPNVALSKYDDSFSASRAATKDWEHTLVVRRGKVKRQFYQRNYVLFLEIQILTNKVSAPGYLKALQEGNQMAVEAYRNTRFVGANFPHIDPEKEARAERLKLGGAAVNMPLTTIEAATEVLNGGDSTANMIQFTREMADGGEYGKMPVKQAKPEGGKEKEEKDES